jgi:hypothetical protein
VPHVSRDSGYNVVQDHVRNLEPIVSAHHPPPPPPPLLSHGSVTRRPVPKPKLSSLAAVYPSPVPVLASTTAASTPVPAPPSYTTATSASARPPPSYSDANDEYVRKECLVCTDEKGQNQYPRVAPAAGCNHEPNTCLDCLEQRIKTELQDYMTRIRCPECSAEMTAQEIMIYADPTTFEL